MWITQSCNPTRRLDKGEYLVDQIHVKGLPKAIEPSEAESFIRQKPNRNILGLRFHLWLYNLIDKRKADSLRIVRNKKIDKLNEARAAKGKKLKSKDKLTIREWVQSLGEPPVLLDSGLTQRSASQLKLFLNNKGYYKNTVTDSVAFRKKRAVVYYCVKPNAPYKINQISYKFDDEQLKQYVYTDTSSSLIKSGYIFDVDLLQKERERISKSLRNNGFYEFSKEYIYFRVDSNFSSSKMNVVLGFKKFATVSEFDPDSIIEINHKRYTVNDIYIQPDYNITLPNTLPTDTFKINDYVILYREKLNYRPAMLSEEVLFRKGDIFKADHVEATYKRISDLKAFRYIDIKFVRSSTDPLKLNCFVRLSPVSLQAFTTELEGTNTSTSLGIAGSLIYQNKNLFKGAELFDIKLKGAIESQKLNNDNSSDNGQIPFNTVQFGPELNLSIPRAFFPFNLFKYTRFANPKSLFSTGLNYQQNASYTRSIATISYGFTYNETNYKKHSFYPIDINLVKVALSSNFENLILKNADFLTQYRFSDHLTSSFRYVFQYNNQDIKKRTNFTFFKANLESSGNVLRTYFNLFDPQSKSFDASYRIFGIRFSQYVRADFDWRYYQNLSEHNTIVYRVYFGGGYPLHNLPELPFEKSFIAGGSNGIRAWQARTLGPGIYRPSFGDNFIQVGDNQLEANVEYRFNIFKKLNGAFFMDAGNIWLRKPDANRLGGELSFDFYKQLAVGTGLGARLDFSFFILRLDVGLKVRDPQFFNTNDTWVIKHFFDNNWSEKFSAQTGYQYSFVNYNIGIGYPF